MTGAWMKIIEPEIQKVCITAAVEILVEDGKEEKEAYQRVANKYAVSIDDVKEAIEWSRERKKSRHSPPLDQEYKEMKKTR